MSSSAAMFLLKSAVPCLNSSVPMYPAKPAISLWRLFVEELTVLMEEDMEQKGGKGGLQILPAVTVEIIKQMVEEANGGLQIHPVAEVIHQTVTLQI